jgi:hypothetical protein
MSAHLTSEQMSRWTAGDCTPEAGRHIRECERCAKEAAHLDTVLAEYRSSVIAWTERQKGADAPDRWQPLERRAGFTRTAQRWMLAAAALVIAVTVPICRNDMNRQREEEMFKADVQLWEQVNARVSRTVPTPLEPLMKLVEWEPAGASK